MNSSAIRQTICLVATLLILLGLGVAIAHYEQSVVPRRKLALVQLGMPRNEVVLKLGAPFATYDPSVNPTRPRLEVETVMGGRAGAQSEDAYHLGWVFFRFYYDASERLIGIERQLD